MEYFEQAIERDPAYALAYAGIADSYLLREDIPPQEAYPNSKAAALKAIEIDSTLAEPHASLGLAAMSYDYDWATAERELKTAIELNPSYATAHQWYALYLMMTSQPEEALREIRVAQELDPLSLIINTAAGFFAFFARRYDDAIRESRRVNDMDPSFPHGHLVLALVYEQQGKIDDAIAEFGEVFRLEGDEETAKAISETFAAAGYEATMRDLVKRMLNRPGGLRPPYGFIAHILVRLGDKDEAIAYLENAYEEKYPDLAQFLVDPVFDSISSEPRFQDLLRRIGLKP
jgi:tetratricopeptide (TPR) repeat protein